MHFSKILFMNPAEIRISGISCSFKNIAKIFTVFALKWTVVLIDSVTEESSLRVFVKDQGLEYFERSSSAGSVELSAVVPYLSLRIFWIRPFKKIRKIYLWSICLLLQEASCVRGGLLKNW